MPQPQECHAEPRPWTPEPAPHVTADACNLPVAVPSRNVLELRGHKKLKLQGKPRGTFTGILCRRADVARWVRRCRATEGHGSRFGHVGFFSLAPATLA